MLEDFTVKNRKLDVDLRIARVNSKQSATIHFKGDILFFEEIANPLRARRNNGFYLTITNHKGGKP